MGNGCQTGVGVCPKPDGRTQFCSSPFPVALLVRHSEKQTFQSAPSLSALCEEQSFGVPLTQLELMRQRYTCEVIRGLVWHAAS